LGFTYNDATIGDNGIDYVRMPIDQSLLIGSITMSTLVQGSNPSNISNTGIAFLCKTIRISLFTTN